MASSNRHWPSMFKTTHPYRSPPYQVIGTGGCEEKSPEPKPRWNPRPEQIRILEAIFNSGMVNPSREEIRRIRTKLQEFGHVGDANVFYWFQNRKSRTKSKKANLPKKQQRSNSAASSSSSSKDYTASSCLSNVNNHHYKNCYTDEFLMDNVIMGPEFGVPVDQVPDQTVLENYLLNEMKKQEMMMSNGSTATTVVEDQLSAYSLFLTPLPTDPYINQSYSHDVSAFTSVAELETAGSNPYRVTVFINDVAFDVEAGPFNVRDNFGPDAVLVQSSGHHVATDEIGMTVQSLQQGAFYYILRPLTHFCEWDVNTCDNMSLQI